MMESPIPGFFDDPGTFRLALPPRTELDGGRYVVGRVLGAPGGFGVTYLAWDVSLAVAVAIKEYLPRELAFRDVGNRTVEPYSTGEADSFRLGLEAFIDEGRRLARLHGHPNIVRVRAFFRDHGTAYLVMDYYRGETLAAFLAERGGRVSAAQADALIEPVLGALAEVHAEGMIHRDVKPENIYLVELETGNRRPVLLDFGAARVVLGEHSRDHTAFVSQGYAPPEQYLAEHRGSASAAKYQQGDWTDVYACGATLYRMVAGEKPTEGLARLSGAPLKPLAELAPGVDPAFAGAVEKALAVDPRERPQTMVELQALLADTAGATPRTYLWRGLALAGALAALLATAVLSLDIVPRPPGLYLRGYRLYAPEGTLVTLEMLRWVPSGGGLMKDPDSFESIRGSCLTTGLWAGQKITWDRLSTRCD